MKAKQIISQHGFHLSAAALAVAIYCFWYFLRPFVLLAREQSQLFQWNGEYLLERLAVPGGLAQYVGEMLVQFFVNPTLGALIYALLALLALWLSRRIVAPLSERFPKVKRWIWTLVAFLPPLLLWWVSTEIYVPMTLTVAVVTTLAMWAFLPSGPWARFVWVLLLTVAGYWLLGPAVLLLALALLPSWWKSGVAVLLLVFCLLGSSWLTPYPLRQVARGIDYYWDQHLLGTPEEMRYDMMVRGKQWEELVTTYFHERPQSLALQSAAALAMFQTGRASEQELLESVSMSNKSISSQSSAFLMSDVLMQLGMSNMAQHAAFEAMESVPNHNKSGRALLRLIETNLVAGQPDVALKYLDILDETLLYRKWVQRLRPLALQPELLEKHATYGRLSKLYRESKNVFFY